MIHPNAPAAPEGADPLEAQVFVLLAWRALICARLSDGIVPNLPPQDRPAAEALALRTRTEAVNTPDYRAALDHVLSRVDAAIAAGHIPARQIAAPDGSGPTWEKASRTPEADALAAARLDLGPFQGSVQRLHNLLDARRIATHLRGAA
jgi:hypothetical protein